jgi:hypothetical protein
MPILFVSHASKDDAVATGLETWLRVNGFSDIFVDHYSISGGDSWRQALQAAAGTCRVVLCLVTENWLASNECLAEFDASFYMGKRVIPLFLLPTPHGLDAGAEKRLARVCAHYQGLDFSACLTAGGSIDPDAHKAAADRLKASLREAGALNRVGLDPEAFAIDRRLRPMPFPGLASFGDDDADTALFYGRSREVAETLEELRKVRAEGDLRPFVILGASGAGKSSLLKAGIIPRLRREAPAWLPLRAFRPGADPLLNFAEALSRTLDDFNKVEAHGMTRDRLFEAWLKAERDNSAELTPAGLAALEQVLEAEGRALREAAGRANACILVSIDQAEEMARAEGASADALADYLRVALAISTSRWQLAFTIRTDSFPELQSHRRFQDLKARGYDLRAIPVFRFDSVVEQPAKRYGVEVDTALIDALMDDAPKEDALPLLAFALQRLWRQYAASGTLSKQNYDKVGGLRGLIEDAAERALRGMTPDQDVPLPARPPTKRRIDLAESTFVPALAQVNDQGATIRRIAAWSGFNDEQQELLTKFDEWRLVVRRAENEGGTVEVAHEALFREWTRLRSWLEPERVRLEALRSITTAAEVWNRQGRGSAWLDHRSSRLRAASALGKVPRYQRQLGPVQQAYLVACRRARLARAGRLCAVLLSLLAVGTAAGVAVDNKLTFEGLLAEADTLNQRSDFFDRNHDYRKAVRFALGVLPGGSLFDWSRPRECLGETLADSECALRRTGFIEPMVNSPASQGKNERFTSQWRPPGELEVVINHPTKGPIKITIQSHPGRGGFSGPDERPSVEVDPTFRRLLIIYSDQSPTLINLDTVKKIADLPGYVFAKPASRPGEHRDELRAKFAADGDSVLTTMPGQDARLWNAEDGSLRQQFHGYAQFVAGGQNVLTGADHELVNTKTLASIATFAVSSWAGVNDAETMAAGVDQQGNLNVWDLSGGTLYTALPLGSTTNVTFWANPSGSRIVTLLQEEHFDKRGRMVFWNGQTAAQLANINDFSLGAFFYHPTVSFAAGADRSALWTVDYDVLAWNGARLIRRSAIPKAQLGTPWFGYEDSGAPLQYSADGQRLLAQRFNAIVVLDSTNLAPISFVRVPLQQDHSERAYVPPASFEDPNGLQVRSGTMVWHLTEAGRLHGKDLRDWMCSAIRLKASEYDHSITANDRQNWYLGGRPADVCMWKGLTTTAGWRQLISRLWFVVSGHDVYAGG